jgi:hypothetical protein
MLLTEVERSRTRMGWRLVSCSPTNHTKGLQKLCRDHPIDFCQRDRLQQPIACRGRPLERGPAYDYDTDHSIWAVDLETQISKAFLGPSSRRNRYLPPSYPRKYAARASQNSAIPNEMSRLQTQVKTCATPLLGAFLEGIRFTTRLSV